MKITIDIDDYTINSIKNYYDVNDDNTILPIIDDILFRYLNVEYFDPEFEFENIIVEE